MNAAWLTRRWPNLIVIVPIIVATWNAPAHSEEDLSSLSCGPNSLYVLLELTGRHTDMKDLLRTLPAVHPKGYSLLELQGAGRQRGLDLWGGYLTRENIPLDRPVIAFFDGSQARSGHYAVLVPVGRTGTMVQLIDPPYYPMIIDYTSIISAGSSVKILYPLSFWQSKWHVIALTTILFIIACFLLRSRFGFITFGRRIKTQLGGVTPRNGKIQ